MNSKMLLELVEAGSRHLRLCRLCTFITNKCIMYMETAQAGRQLNQCTHKYCEGFYMDVSVVRVVRST